MANEQREAEKQSLLNFLLAHVGRRMGAPLHGVVDTQTNVNSEYGCSQMISSPLSWSSELSIELLFSLIPGFQLFQRVGNPIFASYQGQLPRFLPT